MASGSKALVGKAAQALEDFPGSFGVFCGVLRPFDRVFYKYLGLYFQSPFYRKEMSRLSVGVNINNLRREHIEDLFIPLPPLAEQERIVARIEALFTQLDAGVAALEAVRGRVRRYRQAVLQAAVRGELFKQDGNRVDGNLPDAWKKNKLSEFAEVRLGRQRSPSRAVGPNMTRYLRAANVTWNGLDLSDVKQMDFSPKEQEVYSLRPGDVLLNEASGSIGEVGKPAVWRGEIENCCFQNTLLRVRSKGPLPEYLYYHFLHDATTERFRSVAKGVGIHHLGAEGLSNWVVTIPPLEDQKLIISEIEQRFTIAAHIDENITLSLLQSTHLRQSILQRAFTGKL